MMLLYILLVLVIAYWVALEYLGLHWNKLQPPATKTQKAVIAEGCRISIIVVVRNEAQNLPALFKALAQQTLNPAFFELHLVNDASEDNTLAVAKDFQSGAPFKVYIHELEILQRGGSPKKAAITQVLPYTAGALIAVTDGDCIPENQWLSNLLLMWQQEAPVFISGPVRYTGEQSLFEQMQSLDFAALIGVGASMLAAGKPGMCNAANMAFSKIAFNEAGGYRGNEQVPSGDDEFLLQKLAALYPERIFFSKSRGSIVSTSACSSWQQFLYQRKRWAGKWRLHKGVAAKVVAPAVGLFYLLLFACYLLPFIAPALTGWALLVLLIKAIADYRFLKSILHFLEKPLFLKVFMLMEFVYPFYVLFFAVAANVGSFTWKERSYRYTTKKHERTGISGVG